MQGIRLCHRQVLPGSADLDQIKTLGERCSAVDDLALRIVVGKNDWLAYAPDGSNLIGYLCCYMTGEREMEVSGMVHPQWRRKGIFTALLREVRAYCRTQKTELLLGVCPDASGSAAAFMRAAGALRHHSEYRMELTADDEEQADTEGLRLRAAVPDDVPELERQNLLYFGGGLPGGYKQLAGIYLAEADGALVGKVETAKRGQLGYIYGLGVLPQQRRQGHGRRILAGAVHLLLKEGCRRICLEVATENRTALRLYESCGFQMTAAYDYWAMPLQESP